MPRNMKRPIDTATPWLPKTLEVAKDLASQRVEITVKSIASAVGVAAEDAEAQLRTLTQRGFLYMGAAKVNNVFSHYYWTTR